MGGIPEGVGTIGFLADTHSMKADGSDLPDGVLKAFARCDLVVHLGDIGRKGILDRLEEVAPVLVPFGANKGYLRHGTDDAPSKVVETAHATVGMWFNLAQPDKLITVHADTIDFGAAPFDKLMQRRFKQAVDVVAFAGTHRPLAHRHEGVLFVNPGSPTLPEPGTPPSVAVVDVRAATPKVKLVTIS